MRKGGKDKLITISEVKQILEASKDLNDFQRRALEFARKFSKIEARKARELLERLIKEFGLTEEEAVQIVNCMPKSTEELETFFYTVKRRVLLIPKLNEILKLIDEYR